MGMAKIMNCQSALEASRSENENLMLENERLQKRLNGLEAAIEDAPDEVIDPDSKGFLLRLFFPSPIEQSGDNNE